MKEAFFNVDETRKNIYHPTPFARGPWDPKTLHGRVLSGLVAFEVEENCLSENESGVFQASRITVDLFRPPPMSPLICHQPNCEVWEKNKSNRCKYCIGH